MTSVQRTFSQRNNNVTQIIPVFTTTFTSEGNPLVDLSNVPMYVLNIPNVQTVGGIYYVDLNGTDTSKNLLDVNGRINTTASIINFAINVPFNAAYAPGLEFTIFFKNVPISRIPQVIGPFPIFTIGILSSIDIPIPYILSPPAPLIINLINEYIGLPPSVMQSITFKSDGTSFNVVSSGPAGWMGLYAFAQLLGLASL